MVVYMCLGCVYFDIGEFFKVKNFFEYVLNLNFFLICVYLGLVDVLI